MIGYAAPWYRTYAFKRMGRTDFVVGIYNEQTRESEGIASVYGNTPEQAEATARLIVETINGIAR